MHEGLTFIAEVKTLVREVKTFAHDGSILVGASQSLVRESFLLI